MGYMEQGTWVTSEPKGRIRAGKYVRPKTQFRSTISDARDARFRPEAGRYHLFVAHACPWAHRALMLRALKGLEDVISVAFATPYMLENGWELEGDGDTVTGARYMHDVYRLAAPDYSGRCSVPVLWDRQHQTIVSNESEDIVRLLNSAFDSFATRECPDLFPEALQSSILEVNELVYHNVNNGVYKCGFATAQEAYEDNFNNLFAALDTLEARLAENRYLCGPQITEADWRLFATLIRFDAVYVGHFKCNLRRIADYPNLSNYTRELYQWPNIAGTLDLEKTKQHYYGSHESINPHRIVPCGPALNFDAPHDRGRLEAA